MKGFLSPFLTYIDLLGYYPQLFINKGSTYNTLLGGFISLFVWLGIFYALIAYTVEVLFIRNPSVMNYSILRSNVPVFNLSANEHFEFMMLLFDDNFNIVSPNLTQIDIQLVNEHKYYVKSKETNGTTVLNSSIEEQYGFGQCSKETKIKMVNSFTKYLQTLPEYVLCPQYDVNKLRKFGGSLIYGDDEFKTLIKVGPKCQNANKCTQKEFDNFIEYTNTQATNVLFAINYFIPNPKEIQPKTNVFKSSLGSLKNTANKFTVRLAEVSMETNSNLFPLIGGTDYATFFTVDGVFNNVVNHGKTLSSLTTEFEILITDFLNKYERSYPKVDSIITRFFSFYLYLLYVGTIARGMLHTFNLERFLINSTLINESSINIKFENLKSRAESFEVNNESNINSVRSDSVDLRKNLVSPIHHVENFVLDPPNNQGKNIL